MEHQCFALRQVQKSTHGPAGQQRLQGVQVPVGRFKTGRSKRVVVHQTVPHRARHRLLAHVDQQYRVPKVRKDRVDGMRIRMGPFLVASGNRRRPSPNHPASVHTAGRAARPQPGQNAGLAEEVLGRNALLKFLGQRHHTQRQGTQAAGRAGNAAGMRKGVVRSNAPVQMRSPRMALRNGLEKTGNFGNKRRRLHPVHPHPDFARPRNNFHGGFRAARLQRHADRRIGRQLGRRFAPVFHQGNVRRAAPGGLETHADNTSASGRIFFTKP